VHCSENDAVGMKYINNMSGVILHDYFIVRGGAENTVIKLAQSMPGSSVWTGAWDRIAVPELDIPSQQVRVLGARAHPIWMRPLSGIQAFRRKTKDLEHSEWAFYSGSYAPMAVHNRSSGMNILYCHNIPRFAYDLYNYYLSQIPLWQRPPFRALVRYVQSQYESAITKMDVVIANSENVKKRLQTYLNQPSEVIHPPCGIENFSWLGQSDYYISLARLEPFKRVDVIVKAFLQMPDKRLVVASDGSERTRLENLAAGAENISFTGWLDDASLRSLIGNAIASIYIPIDEDFGMSPVQSMASGKPVVGIAQGGLCETIIDKDTGILLGPMALANSIMESIRDLTPKRALEMKGACLRQSEKFTDEKFIIKMQEYISLPHGKR